MNKYKLRVAAAAIVCLAIAAVFVFGRPKGYLVLSNGNTGEEYARYRLDQGETFSITFIHSVNKSPVTDCYDVAEDGGIWLRRTIYYDFGAGVPFDLNEVESLEYAEDGAMVITGIDREIPDFLIFVGTVSDHTLRIGGEEISLRDLCGRSAKVRIRYEERWI